MLCRRQENEKTRGASGLRKSFAAVAAVAAAATVVGYFVLRPAKATPIVASLEEAPQAPSPVAAPNQEEENQEEEKAQIRRRFDTQFKEETPEPTPTAEARVPSAATERLSPPKAQSPESQPRGASQEQVRAALAQITVELYATQWCRYCRDARAFLQKNGVRYVEYDTETDPAAKARARDLNPRGGVPVLKIDREVLTGFSAESVGAALAQAIGRRLGVSVEARAFE